MVDGSWDLNNTETTYSSTDGILRAMDIRQILNSYAGRLLQLYEHNMLKLERLNKNTFITVESRAKIRPVIYT